VSRIRVSTVVNAPRRDVWRAIEDIERHTDWMADAVAIRFTSRQRHGRGTTFECDTKVGPFRLTDRMTITEKEPGRRMGVDHTGLVTGTGRLSLARARGGRTRVTWRERLAFPWWMGGPVGGVVIAQVLKIVWRRSMRQLKELVEGG